MAARLDMPVLLVIYRRPECTKQVFEAIRRAQPRRLFVAADGPASDAERDACERTRAVVGSVDWECDLTVDFAPANLGLTPRMTTALDWFFNAVDAGVILEDDCLPSDAFFPFCAELLDRYRDDRRVMHVSGETYEPRRRGEGSYVFSKYPLIWGWATWRRAWRHFDLSLRTWPRFRHEREAHALFDSRDERDYWHGVFDGMHAGRIPAVWEYAWDYACMTQGLSIHPAVNMVANIGYGAAATHTRDDESSLANRPVYDIEPGLRHPDWVVRDRQADEQVFAVRYPGDILKRQRTVRHQLCRPLRWLRRSLRSRR